MKSCSTFAGWSVLLLSLLQMLVRIASSIYTMVDGLNKWKFGRLGKGDNAKTDLSLFVITMRWSSRENALSVSAPLEAVMAFISCDASRSTTHSSRSSSSLRLRRKAALMLTEGSSLCRLCRRTGRACLRASVALVLVVGEEVEDMALALAESTSPLERIFAPERLCFCERAGC